MVNDVEKHYSELPHRGKLAMFHFPVSLLGGQGKRNGHIDDTFWELGDGTGSTWQTGKIRLVKIPTTQGACSFLAFVVWIETPAFDPQCPRAMVSEDSQWTFGDLRSCVGNTLSFSAWQAAVGDINSHRRPSITIINHHLTTIHHQYWPQCHDMFVTINPH